MHTHLYLEIWFKVRNNRHFLVIPYKTSYSYISMNQSESILFPMMLQLCMYNPFPNFNILPQIWFFVILDLLTYISIHLCILHSVIPISFGNYLFYCFNIMCPSRWYFHKILCNLILLLSYLEFLDSEFSLYSLKWSVPKPWNKLVTIQKWSRSKAMKMFRTYSKTK